MANRITWPALSHRAILDDASERTVCGRRVRREGPAVGVIPAYA